MKKIDRYIFIDQIRGMSIFAIIAIHVFAFNLASPVIFNLWNLFQIFVGVFIFCSGFITSKTTISTLQFFKKRIIRILIPFYIYFFIHLLFSKSFPLLFSQLNNLSVSKIISTITFTGGIDLNWLPLLFIELSLFYPIYKYLLNSWKKRIIYIVVLIGITLINQRILPSDINFRFYMFYPWLIIYTLGYYYSDIEKIINDHKKLIKYYYIFCLSIILLTILFIFKDQNIILRDHKYPPDLLYIILSTIGIMIVLLISKLSIFKNIVIQRILNYLSVHSYNLFFIHIIVIDFYFTFLRKFIWTSNSLIALTIVLVISILIDLAISKIRSYLTFLYK